ncbi:FliH/SctL family protein [Pigmentiphaga sp.]|uniref:FliH/SctL family protein n=1 Tax=Pigmentiphaga sp. TaxID=1977564 RepID=UPI0025EE9875|nr:FliH/SctL family protein [Pigmentiphaga sp.]
MDSFCVERVSIPPRLRARHGLLRSRSLAVCADAERAAELALRLAREQADAVLEQSRAEAAAAVLCESQRVARQATDLLQGLESAQTRLLDGVETLAVELAAQAFTRLAADMAPAERIAASVRRVREEAPAKLSEAVVWVNPDDLALLGDSPWDARPDARLARGACRLEASSGEWHASFDLAVAALEQALAAHGAEARIQGEHGVDES